jgi:hypothetical protein
MLTQLERIHIFPNANANEPMFFAVSSHRGTTKARPLLRDLLKIPLG